MGGNGLWEPQPGRVRTLPCTSAGMFPAPTPGGSAGTPLGTSPGLGQDRTAATSVPAVGLSHRLTLTRHVGLAALQPPGPDACGGSALRSRPSLLPQQLRAKNSPERGHPPQRRSAAAAHRHRAQGGKGLRVEPSPAARLRGQGGVWAGPARWHWRRAESSECRSARAPGCGLSRGPASPGPPPPPPPPAGGHRPPALAQLPASSRGAGPQVIRQLNAGGPGYSGLWGDGSCSHVSEQGPPVGRVNVRAGAGPKGDAGLWQPRPSADSPAGLPPQSQRQRGERGSGSPAPRHGGSPSFSGEKWGGRRSGGLGLGICSLGGTVQDRAA